MTNERGEDPPYDRARRDPEFLGRFTAAYDGDQDPLDALWWHDHPSSPSPSGREAPAAELERLSAQAFSPGSDTDDAVQRYRAARDAVARERARVDRALREASATRTEGSHSLTTPDNHPVAPPTDEQNEPVPPGRRRRRPWLAPAAVAGGLGLAIGALVGGMVWTASGTNASDSADGPSASADPDAGSPPGGLVTVDASAALAVFDTPQEADDIPPELQNLRLDTDTLRLLTGEPAPVYAARDIDQNVCVLLVQSTGAYTAACTPPDAFPWKGLLLEGSYLIPTSGGPSGGGGTFVDVTVRWLPTGEVGGGTLRPIPTTP